MKRREPMKERDKERRANGRPIKNPNGLQHAIVLEMKRLEISGHGMLPLISMFLV